MSRAELLSRALSVAPDPSPSFSVPANAERWRSPIPTPELRPIGRVISPRQAGSLPVRRLEAPAVGLSVPSSEPASARPGRAFRAASVSSPQASKASHAEHSPATVRDARRCKERPDNSRRGNGSGPRKEFVPWCDRK